MLPFFRKIRYRLAQDNQFLKYSRYAIGEIVLVVIGILIALQINNWNEERKKKNDIKGFMQTLVIVLETEKIKLEGWGGFNESRFQYLQHLLVLSGQNANKSGYDDQFEGESIWPGTMPAAYDSTFVEKAFLYSAVVGDMEPMETTLEMLKNNGLFSEIEKDTVKMSIGLFYIQYNQRLGDAEMTGNQEYINDWLDSLSSNGYTPQDIGSPFEALQWLKSDVQATARLRNLISNAKWRYESAYFLAIEAQKLIDLIKDKFELQG